MKNVLKNRLIYILLIAFVVAIICCSFSLIPNKTAKAEEVDYVNQNYADLPGNWNCSTEGIVYKIHCPDVRTELGLVEEENMQEYVTTLSFKNATGCQIYFVKGVPCDLENAYYGDNKTSIYSDYYEILYYDSENENVYITLKNIDQLSYPEDVGFLKGESVNRVQYIFMSEMEEPITEITNSDVYFSDDVFAAHGGRGLVDYSIYSMEYILKVSQRVSHLIDEINVEISQGKDSFYFHENLPVLEYAWDETGYTIYKVSVFTDISKISEKVQLKAVITYGDKQLDVYSSAEDLMTLWTTAVNNNFSHEDYVTYMTEQNKTHIRRLVNSYNNGFLTEIKGSKYHFADYKSNSDLKVSSLIFKISIENFRSASFGWYSNYYNGNSYTLTISIGSDFRLTSKAYSQVTNPDGSISDSMWNPQYNDTVAKAVLDSVDYFAYDDSLYIRIKDDTSVNSYFPSAATRQFSVSASDKSGKDLIMQANTATIIYDEYNQALLEEIELLNAQVANLEEQLTLANAEKESLKGENIFLDAQVVGLQNELARVKGQLDYMTEQIEVMRKEYQAKIDQIINGTGDGQIEPKPEENKPVAEEGLSTVQIVGICCGSLMLVLLVLLLIPKRRNSYGKNKKK